MDHIQIDADEVPMTLQNTETQDSCSDCDTVRSESNSSSSEEIEIDQDSQSDCESESPVSDPFGAFTENEITVRVEGLERETITKSFVSGMGPAGGETRVVAVHKNSSSGLTRRARFDSFRVFTEAVARKCGGNPNIKYGWYGGSKDEIAEILVHGFSAKNEKVGGRIQLVPVKFALDAAVGSGVDEDGMRHVLMCRVILGKSELMPNGSDQIRPRSSEFDSGVDSLVTPRKYIVWSNLMNSHICPAYVVSFKAPGCLEKYAAPPQKTISFLDLLPVLARFLPPSKMAVLCQLRDDYWDKKITLAELHGKLKREVDGKVLASAMRLVTPRQGNSGAFPAPGTVNLPHLMKVLPLLLPASEMAIVAKSRDDFLAKKISLAEVSRQVRPIVDKKVMASAMKLMKPAQTSSGLHRGPLVMAALARFLPPSQMKILGRLIMDFRAKKISGDELDRKFKLIVDDKVLASALKLVTPSTQQRSNTASDIRDLLKVPNSSIYFPALMPVFERSLSPQKMALLTKSLNDLKAKKITRPQLLQRAKLIVGNELLVAAVKSYRSSQQHV
ncbi:putative poly(ADP-ribose) polymerase, catalytic domain, RST domain of plant [Rosa chinensis]|uniref:Putative poly(ADP-ribose) polymerase, catalytic domain, RST domain of plant n=1 Tax=Rosa chinensis TaxID=74649 RepID=A0A2P6Q9Z9_ROSCH|nr:putative poly(ADP-ribose) polymerase, catalytic domain, RST domain of plant [Rosa chinensis]